MTDAALDHRALALLDEALELPPGEREAFVQERCAADLALRDRILRLLASDTAGAALRTGGFRLPGDASPPPERIGAYAIRGTIGRGGMGVVYRGERIGDFEHIAAIKVIRPGVLSDTLIERFMRERQTLARLSHPAIARLFDGGETPGGEPYIVMELVDGVPLDAWLATVPPPAQRVALMLGLCEAVGYAHQNLIVHRDLTPTNVLVQRDGTPKLIDFGIARPPAIGPAGEMGASGRSLGGLSLTPGFAAPERLQGAPATTLGDIYSLGRLLDRVFDGERDADLDAIIARATALQPEDRYPSPDAMRDDIAAWRDRMPVQARRGGRRYLAARFIARHRAGVAAVAAALLLLIGALGVTLWSYARAEAARRTEAERFAQVRALARFMIFDLNGSLAQVAGNTAARARIAAEAQRYLDALVLTPGASPALKVETARGLIRLARIQGVPTEPNLGEIARATTNLDAAQRLLGGVAASAATVADRALIHIYRGLIDLHGKARQAEGARELAIAARLLTPTSPASPDTAWYEAQRALRRAQLDLADLSDRRMDIPAIIARMTADRTRWPSALRASSAAAEDAAYAGYYGALHAASADRLADSVARHLQTGERYDALLARTPNDPSLLSTATWNQLDGFGTASRLGREDVSNRMIVKAKALVDRLSAIDDRDRAVTALSMNISEALAQNLRDRDRFADAIALQSEVVSRRRASARAMPDGRSLGNLGFSLAILGVIGKDAGARNIACDSWREAEHTLAAIEARRTILGFHQGFLPGLRRNVERCRSGAPLTEMGPLRS